MRTWRKPKPNPGQAGDGSDDACVLRPLDGAASLIVQSDSSMTADTPSYTGALLVWSVYTGAEWRRIADLDPRHERQGLGLSITSVPMADGQVRVAAGAGVAGGAPVGVVEVTNATSTPMAVGVAVESPGKAHVVDRTLWLGTQPLLTSWSPPRSGSQAQSNGDEPQLVVPVPHTATARFTVPLGDRAPWIATGGKPTGAVPTLDDIERGWDLHLARGLRFAVDGDERWGHSTDQRLHAILTSSPDEVGLDDVTAAALYGFGLPAGHVSAALEQVDSTPAGVLVALGTWNRLHAPSTQASDEITEHLIVAAAKAAHLIERSRAVAPVPLGWGSRPLTQLSHSMDIVGQPDIAERLLAVSTRLGDEKDLVSAPPSLSTLDRWRTGADNPRENNAGKGTGGQYLVGLRQRFLDSRSNEIVTLLTDLAPAWRGRAVEVFNAPVGDATMSYGLRWHGARPALLWSIEPPQTVSALPMLMRVPAIDPGWTTSESSGEVLLADPGW